VRSDALFFLLFLRPAATPADGCGVTKLSIHTTRARIRHAAYTRRGVALAEDGRKRPPAHVLCQAALEVFFLRFVASHAPLSLPSLRARALSSHSPAVKLSPPTEQLMKAPGSRAPLVTSGDSVKLRPALPRLMEAGGAHTQNPSSGGGGGVCGRPATITRHEGRGGGGGSEGSDGRVGGEGPGPCGDGGGKGRGEGGRRNEV